MRVRFCLPIIVLLLSAVAPNAVGDSESRFRSAASDDGVDAALHGIWASRGYGWIADVRDDGSARLYDHSTVACTAEDVPPEELLSFIGLFHRDGDTLQVTSALRNATIYTFDRIDRVPEVCATDVEATPETVLAHFSALMGAHYAFFETYDVDWPARQLVAADAVEATSTDAQLFGVLGEMLDGMRDGHLRLMAEIDGEREMVRPGRAAIGPMLDTAFARQSRFKDVGAFQQRWYASQRKQVRKKLLRRSAREAGDGQLVWGKVGRVGYLAIFGMGGFSPDDDASREESLEAVNAAMTSAIEDLADTDALVVDVSMNGGGMDEVSLVIAGHFADTETLAFTKRAHDAAGAQPQSFHIIPATQVRYMKPLTLLTSNFTVSAAEIFTMAMRALPQVTHHGETTRGALSDVLEKALVNDWILTISNEVYRDSEGILWEGKGIPPRDPITVFDPQRIETSRLEAIRTAIARTEAALDAR